MVESFEIINKPKRICRGRGRGRRGRGGRCLHRSDSEVGGDVFFTLELCRSDDVLIEILTRLPLKSIFRFKCVSKSWHRLISEDHFRVKMIEIERNKMEVDPPLYFFQTPKSFNAYYLDPPPHILKDEEEEEEEEEEDTTRRHTWNFLAEVKSVSSNSSCPTGNKFKVERVEVDHCSDVVINNSNNNDNNNNNNNRGRRGIVCFGGGDDFKFFICCSNGLLLGLVSHWINSPPPRPCRLRCIECCIFYQRVTRYYIYNPLTKLGYLLPSSPSQSRPQCSSHGTLMVSCPWFGRGCVALVVGSSSSSSSSDYDMVDGYEVVRARASLSNSNIIELETFSSHTGEWRLSTVTVTVDTHKCFSKNSEGNVSVHVTKKRSIYWMVGVDSFDYIFAYNPVTVTKEEEEEEEEEEELEHNDNNPAGVIEIIKAPDGNFTSNCVGMGESVDGLLQVATLKWFFIQHSGIKIWVYHPRDCRWLLRRQLPVPDTIRRALRPVVEQAVISFHPLNPNILFIRSFSGWIFACHLNTTPILVEPLVRFNLLNRDVTVRPYLLPPWPISPFPAAAQKN